MNQYTDSSYHDSSLQGTINGGRESGFIHDGSD